MSALVLALDLGTGGCKASLWSDDGACLAETVRPYPTRHPAAGRNEQRPADWWDAVVDSSRHLLAASAGASTRVAGIALSGQSLGVVPLDGDGELVLEATPIWSDARGAASAGRAFSAIAEADWYRRTGNGFGAALYPLFKIGVMREEAPDAWGRVSRVLGSKDWINFRLTGEIATDHSSASGSGAYSLAVGAYDDELLAAGGVERGLLPEPRESHDQVGTLTDAAARRLGLPAGVPVFAGAVDNACMALGSRGIEEGSLYAALGSSSWMTVTSTDPVLDDESRPYVFRHAIPGKHVSALSTFSSGTSLGWLRDRIAPELSTTEFIDRGLAVEPGARGVQFLPMLAGGTPLEGGPGARGAFLGLELGHAADELARAALEGIAFALRRSLDRIRALSGSREPVLVSGGGAQHDGWNQLYADVLDTTLERSTVDQHAATLGAATVAFVGLGAWEYRDAARPHSTVAVYDPAPGADDLYRPLRERFDRAVAVLARLHSDSWRQQ